LLTGTTQDVPMQTKPVLLILKLNYTLTIAKWSSLLLKNKPIRVIYWVLLNYQWETNETSTHSPIPPFSDLP
jgi:hypothetical protein